MKKAILIFTSLILALTCLMPLADRAEAQISTVLDQNEMIRFMYWLVNGPPGGTYPTGLSGPDEGFLGMIRDLTGVNALGGGLADAGYTECSLIPDTGSAEMVDTEGTWTMTFATPIMTIPTGYPGGGGNYAKRVEVQFDGTLFMYIEFECDSEAGWIRFFEPMEPAATARNIEVYYDTTDSDNTMLELYMYYEPGVAPTLQEYFMAKFSTAANGIYNIWITRSGYEDQGSGPTWSGFRTVIHGSTALTGPGAGGVANAFIFQGLVTETSTAVTADTGTVFTGDIDCIDFNGGGTALDAGPSTTDTCTANSLTLSEAGAPILDGTGDFSVNWVTTSIEGAMTTLP